MIRYLHKPGADIYPWHIQVEEVVQETNPQHIRVSRPETPAEWLAARVEDR